MPRSRPAPPHGVAVPPPWWPALLAAAVAGAVYLPSLAGGFVYDSRMQVVTDPFLHDPANWFDVLTFRVLARDVLDGNRPVQLASLMLDSALWGREALGYHLTSILLHAVNAAAVAILVARLLALPPRWNEPVGSLDRAPASRAVDLAAAGAGLLFAVHPLMVEAVSEPSYREDLLATAFTLVGVLLTTRLPLGPGAAPDWPRVAGIVAAYLLAIGSKESGIAAAALSIAWMACAGGLRRTDRLAAAVGGVLVAAAFLAARMALAPERSAIFSSPPVRPGGSLAAVATIQPRILALYVWNVVCPVSLSADYGPWSVSGIPFAGAAAVVLALLGGAVAWGWRDRRAAFAAALVVVPLLPVCNLVAIYKPIADRYLYLPMVGVAALVAVALAPRWSAFSPRARRLTAAVGAGLLALLAAGSIVRQQAWLSALALWSDTSRASPESPVAALGLAEAFVEAGKPVEAERAAVSAIRLSAGTWADTWIALALALDRQGREEEAQGALDKALALDPRFAEPSACVARLAMHRPAALALDALLARRGGRSVPAAAAAGASTGLPAPVASPDPTAAPRAAPR